MRDLNALPNLTIALVQTSLAWHDRQANFDHFELLLEQARGADLIVLPEMFTTGFSMESQTLAEPENGPTHRWLQAQARKYAAVITGSVIIRAADGSHRNRLLWARPDGEVLHYDKRHLFRMAGEHHHYTPGERQVQCSWSEPTRWWPRLVRIVFLRPAEPGGANSYVWPDNTFLVIGSARGANR